MCVTWKCPDLSHALCSGHKLTIGTRRGNRPAWEPHCFLDHLGMKDPEKHYLLQRLSTG